MPESTALALPTGTALDDVFRRQENLDPLIKRIEDEVRSHVPDLTTAKGRDAIASLAYKVSRSKTALDEAGKKLTEDAKREISVVDAARKKIRDKLDALRDEARKPLTEWEQAEKDRVQRAKDALEAVRHHGMAGDEGSADIRAAADVIKAVEAKEEYGEYLPQIEAAREATLNALRGMYAAAKNREDQEAELEALRAEKAEREAKEQAEREAREAAALAAELVRIEQERLAQIERDKQEAAQRAAEEAEKRAAAAEAERAEAAIKAERDRLDAEKKAEADARAKREADQEHRAKITSDIVAALSDMRGNASPEQIAEALIAGKIPHVTVNM